MVLLTPAEELGLSGLHLDARVRKVLYHLPAEEIRRLMGKLHEEGVRRNLVYMRDGQAEAIRVLLRPLAVMPDQLNYLHYVTLTILNALKRMPDLYLEDPDVRTIVPLEEEEDRWLRETWTPAHRENNPVIGRLDATFEFTSPMWKDTLRFVEPNLTGIGGICMGPTCDRLLGEFVLPVIEAADATLHMETTQDLRELFLQEILDHLEAIGSTGGNICLVEPRFAGTGPVEQAEMVRYFRERHGLAILHADPAELSLRGSEVFCGDRRVDVAYRDYEIRDLLDLASQGVDVAPMRELFRQNRMVSSLAGEFDHKSCWEVLTDVALARRHFNTDERQVFRRHVLWTRVLADRQTTLPDGEQGDLLRFARREREFLVIKPNRAYGGEGVIIGQLVDQREWEAAIEQAVGGAQPWVVQRLATLPVNEFHVVDDDGTVHIEPFYTVMGFAPTKFGVGLVGRCSQKQVVNVAQRGGMCGVLVARPVVRLIGPGAPAPVARGDSAPAWWTP
jgi:hypothetical protein